MMYRLEGLARIDGRGGHKFGSSAVQQFLFLECGFTVNSVHSKCGLRSRYLSCANRDSVFIVPHEHDTTTITRKGKTRRRR